ncbi:MAG: ISAzo13-like element transposase-related protein, partial [Acidimicrobiales bacterium]
MGILATRARLGLTVANFPLRTTKWNRIEHRLASVVSVNWQRRPLASHEVIICLIANTSTPTGVDVRTRLEQSVPKSVSSVTLDENGLRSHSLPGGGDGPIRPGSAGAVLTVRRGAPGRAHGPLLSPSV